MTSPDFLTPALMLAGGGIVVALIVAWEHRPRRSNVVRLDVERAKRRHPASNVVPLDSKRRRVVSIRGGGWTA